MAIDKSLIISNSEIADVAEKPQVSHPGSDKPVETTTSTIDSNSSTKEVDEDKTAGLPIDRGWAWVVLLAAGFYLMLFGGIRKNFGIFFVEIQSRFQSSASITSFLNTSQNLVMSISSPIVMLIGLQFISNRASIMAGSLVLTTAFIITSQATDIKVLFLSIGCLEGIGTALVHPPVIAIIGEYFHKRRGFAMAVAMSGASFGGLIFAPIMSALFEQLGYTGTLMIVAGMTLNFCVAGSLMRPIKSFERTSNGDGSEIEMETLISKSNGVKPHMNSTDEIIAQLVIEQENNHIRMLPAKAVLQLKQSENPHTKLVRSESLEPVKDRNKMKPAESPLLPRARAWSTGTRRQRTVSVQSEVSAAPSHKALSPLNSLVETLSHSRIAIYSSMAEGLYGSVLDIQEIGVDKRTANGHAYVVPKQSICDKLRSSFDFGIFRSTVFPLFLCMAALLSSISILMPSFLPPHAKDLGLLPEQRGLLLSVVGGVGMASRLLLALLADRDVIRLTTLLAVLATLVGVTMHLLRFFQGFHALIAVAAIE
ncbi:uncharacterized protein LOC128209813 isoform X2 [Mya arenaria]|uniref:uncharacterized protein LOC128209813 isoform X2 n=1 Tax=Mya arenaria TaxID=6604 RepID=UPI0022E06D73|nr:uncharacterized protein LOC128209813 isoform X2 [Mya arenaria]